jgi:hypothetical protein
VASSSIHIADRPVVPVGQPSSSGSTWINTDILYDIAIAGVPFFFATNDKYPYKRSTAPYRKNQTDTQKEPGEQSITGWWLRSQSSFHYGSGVRYQEPLAGDNVQYRFLKSAGVDVFNAGQVTLLPDMSLVRSISGTPIMVPATYNGVDMAYIADGSTLYMYNGTTTVTVSWGGTGTIFDVTQDGVYYYVGNATGIYRGTLDGGAGSLIFANPSTATSMKLGYAKQRVIAGINNSVYEIVPINTINIVGASLSMNMATITTATAHNLNVGQTITVAGINTTYNNTWTISAIPSATQITYYHNHIDADYAAVTGTVTLTANNNNPIYTHPATTWKWTGICDGPNAIYISGYSGVSGGIFRLALDTTGAVPLLNKALTAADMPQGEYVTTLGSYLGKYLIIGTNRGVRVGQIDTSGWLSSGYITYGPLSVVTSGWDPAQGKILYGSAVTSVSFQDRFAYCTVTNYIDNGDGTFASGLIKIDLSKEVNPNQFAFATDRRVSTITATASAVCSLGSTNNLMIGYAGIGVYQQTNTLVSSGYIQTGQIRYFTLEDKHFELLKIRMGIGQQGKIQVTAVAIDGTQRPIITVDGTFDYTQDLTAIDALDTSPQASIGLKFTLIAASGQTVGSEDTFLGYQLKATPAVKRQRLISLPLMNYDFNEDRNNMITGKIGAAYERLQNLEAIESGGDVVLYQDLSTGETQRCIIEEQEYARITAPDRAFSGDGGVIYCTIRTVS